MNISSKFFAEIIGTAMLLAIGLGVVASVVLFSSADNVAFGGYTNIVIGWGAALMISVYAVGGISGAHLNPAVSLAMWIIGKLSFKETMLYIIAQFIGAFIGAVVVFAVYYYKWIAVDPDFIRTASIFATVPAVNNFTSGLIDQIVGTFILVVGVMAIIETKSPFNNPAFVPLALGLLLIGIGASFGAMHGFAINPARDLGPRLFAVVAGFSNTGFADIKIWTVPIIGPIAGGMLGALFYRATLSKMYAKKI